MAGDIPEREISNRRQQPPPLRIREKVLRKGRQVVRKSENIVLIGMPGVGKSTIGVILAKVLSRDFLDTDVYIQAEEGRTLQEIIDREGMEKFCELEERYVTSVARRGAVIATGGSVVYSDLAMVHLKSQGVVLHLSLPIHLLEKRLTDFTTRGVVKKSAQTFIELYDERIPLYERYADSTIDCTGMGHEEVVKVILSRLKERSNE
ncbi:MAG: shikimate kinase [bacterium]